jgi:hypothetical protein
MRRLVLFVAALALSACSGAATPVSPGAPLAQNNVTFSSSTQTGVSAHYVVETGTNADGKLQLDVRPAQARPMLANAKPLTDANVRYPDGSTQSVNSKGLFDASASSYAAKHGQTPKDVKGVVVRIVSASGIALQPTRFALYVPSAATEAREHSYYRVKRIHVTLGGSGLPCEPAYRQKVLDLDAVVQFAITLNSRQGVVDEAVHSCDRGDPDKDARIVGFEYIVDRDLIRWNYYYQAPGADELKGAGITQAREYMEFRVPTLYPVYSPRYLTRCGAQGC